MSYLLPVGFTLPCEKSLETLAVFTPTPTCTPVGATVSALTCVPGARIVW